tara:strand:- start:173 stop:535 length:363 start_codon:yes stop_codon:yes gene_type:complete
MVQDLWVPDGVDQENADLLRRVNPDVTRAMALTYTFTFAYKGQTRRVQVAAADTDSRAEVEDKAADAIYRWKLELDGQEHKPAPTEEEKKEIGSILNEITNYRRKRNESSTGRIYFKGGE